MIDNPPAPAELDRMLRPRSIAIVGASGRAGSIGSKPLEYLLRAGFEGTIELINPGYDEIHGIACHASLNDIEGPVDLVLVLTPADRAVDVIAQAGAVGAAGAIVFGSGFAEMDEAGAALQRELVETGRRAGVRVLGPNCQGLIYAPTGVLATFTAAGARDLAPASGVAYVGQSGALGGSVLDLSNEAGLGLTAWVSTGNQSDLEVVEVASALVEDDHVRVLMMYAEAIPEAGAFIALCRRAAELGKRLVIALSGRSAAGRRAAASHTGSMLGDDTAFLLTCRAFNVVVVDDVDELLAAAATLAAGAPVTGPRFAVVTTSGGAGSLAADHLSAAGMEVPVLGQETRRALSALVPGFGAVDNPVDTTAQLFNGGTGDEALREICRRAAADPEVDAVMVVLTMVTGDLAAMIARALVELRRDLQTPLFVVWLAGQDLTADARLAFARGAVPVFSSVGSAARLARHLVAADSGRALPDVESTTTITRDAELLRHLGISSPRSHRVESPEQAEAAVRAGDGPAALKLLVRDLDHKSDVGGVRLGVRAEEAGTVFEDLRRAALEHGLGERFDGVEVQEMVPAGVEVVVAVTSAGDGYPPVVTVGAGGTSTELLRDVASALAPIGPDEAEDLLRRLRSWPLLDGYRGAPPADVQAAAEAVAAVSRAAARWPGRFELEINPLIVAEKGQGAHAVDFLLSADDA